MDGIGNQLHSAYRQLQPGMLKRRKESSGTENHSKVTIYQMGFQYSAKLNSTPGAKVLHLQVAKQERHLDYF